MIEADERMNSSDRADHVPFHDLHMIDVVKQLHPSGTNRLADLDTPGGMICLIVRMVHFAVQQFEHQGYSGFLRDRRKSAQPGNRNLNASGVIQTLSVPTETDHVGNL